jgi:predicted O-linked N-acetylglucosamine transferase (SPINDLY family)
MGKMVYQALRHHDRARFEVFAYSLSAHEDDFTQTIATACDHFVRLAGNAPLTAAQRIRADDIDILIDCSTHTKGSEPGIVIHRPARCQVTYVASSGCLGSSAIDYKLTDEHLDLPDQQRFQLEPLLTMQRCVFPYTVGSATTPSPYTRKVLRVPQTAMIFGAFVQILKLSPRLLAVWKRILDRLPNAMLAFSPGNMSARQGYINLCAANGIAPERLVFLDAGKTEADNMARFSVIDVVLDTFPYGGINGTLEAISAGVPLVALTGRRNQERTSTSILRYLGVTDSLAQSESQYVEIACKLALDAGFRKAVAEKLRAALPQSSLVDGLGYTRALEDALLRGLADCERALGQRV